MAAGVLAAAVAVAAFGVEYQPAQDSDVSHPRPPLPPPAYLRYCHHIIPIEHQIVFSSWGFEGGGWGFGKVARARAACNQGVRVRQCASPESLSGEAACIATILHSERWTGDRGLWGDFTVSSQRAARVAGVCQSHRGLARSDCCRWSRNTPCR